MTLALGCIADDYTGASDLANTLARNGLRTIQTIGVPSADLPLMDADAVVVALKIRSVPAAEAVEKARAAHRWLTGRGAGHVMYKICSTFDSTDAGNIGPALDALGADTGAGAVLVTPAFPETGRTVYQGHLFVGPVPLNESPLKDHPLNPMHDANLVRVLQRQSQRRIGLAALDRIAGGPDALRARLAELASDGVGGVIADAVFESDLETLGAVALDAPVSVGASGLGLGLARGLVRAGRVAHAAGAAAFSDGPGLSACLAGSCSQATLAQIARAEAIMPVLRLDAQRLLAGPEVVTEAIAWAREHIATGPVLIASSAAPADVLRAQSSLGREAVGQAIEGRLAQIAEELLTLGVRRLVVAGGETSGAVVDRLGIPAFALGPQIAPGVPLLRAVSGAHDGLLMALKSGNFGSPDFFAEALGLMNQAPGA
ncbi:four-carbon acid sugar kinase family protein [Ancylobacter sp. A5.8]|uniref:3-oxo-tetronate kinase n=1 Tax=Ancylobacter gelatini TaxID=2919920 RepID=UPI001F4D35BD|nr:3-oxo-tetronate kinase [Ancylobacter gelatini]MCJ8143680.1 four-carbon acid sugar kinase family protein [Ancylobacter gelatini]